MLKGLEIYDRYLFEIKKCSFYRSKYQSLEKSDRRYEHYRQKFLEHRKKALFYYFQLKEIIAYSEVLEMDDSIKETLQMDESSPLYPAD